jgi:hypothetical protein
VVQVVQVLIVLSVAHLHLTLAVAVALEVINTLLVKVQEVQAVSAAAAIRLLQEPQTQVAVVAQLSVRAEVVLAVQAL